MATNNLGKFRGIALLGAAFVVLVLGATYSAYIVYNAIDTGTVASRSREIALADHPTIFWLLVGWRALPGIACAFFAWRTAIIVARMHQKGALFVAEKPPVQRNSAPLVDDSKTTSLDR